MTGNTLAMVILALLGALLAAVVVFGMAGT